MDTGEGAEGRGWAPATVAASVGLVLALPVTVWWVVGAVTADPDVVDPDYAVRPPSSEVTALLGTVSLTLVVLCGIVVLQAVQRGTFDARWWTALAPALVAGVGAGAAWAVITAPSIGANIGAGFALLLGGPLVAGLLLWSAGCAIWLLWTGGRRP
ncbi:hypothetical protein GCM10023347_33340 [Streptomyces chumphonensis]|uniref:Uncharacterized protein n=1 Tax=Streptomyces chumphonensis TaxID=1214925 RepID=A0A927ICK7_9ACTN|nr:hypothetical protein [Streptomyces chumphonensis]MBD3931995.1 hypothetical protein [Streptomyces chumphonensis]